MKGHISKCIKRLKEWNAPLTGWRCEKVVDVREDEEDIPLGMRSPLSNCELCDCNKVRYEHWMVNDLLITHSPEHIHGVVPISHGFLYMSI